ncbi:DUF4913 domain-containing protein [Micromonospora sp. LOL_024]|uniref:DUF4913 domain-containing protein n=1 Tax=Micromonospora sp. LOL_024 TaxID=3345412 RepID=UPI003A85B2C3
MTQTIPTGEPTSEQMVVSPAGNEDEATEEARPFFILYLEREEYAEELRRLAIWVEQLLLPVYGGEVSSSSPWCPRWYDHREAIAYLHGLWLAWQERTGPQAELSDPANWHQSFLWPTMEALRNPNGPFAGCKPGLHRHKERPEVEQDDFLFG